MIIYDKSKIDLQDEFLSQVLNMVEDFLFIMDSDHTIIQANQRALNFYGQDIIGKKCYQVTRSKISPCADCTINFALRNREVRSREIFNEKTGQYMSMKTYPIVDEEENLLYVVETYKDITRLKRLETEVRRRDSTIRKMTVTDELTGLWNHNYIYRRLREEMKKTRRYGRPFSIVIVDLDDFKGINERYGHSGGDLILINTSKIIAETIRGADLAGRFGGEEFMILVPESDQDGASRLANRLLERIRNAQVEIGDLKVRYTASIGIATFQKEDDYQLRQLIAHGEEAMYFAKSMGKNQAAAFEQIRKSPREQSGDEESSE